MTDINKLQSGNNTQNFESENNEILGLAPVQPEPEPIVQQMPVSTNTKIQQPKPDKEKQNIKKEKSNFSIMTKLKLSGIIMVILLLVNNNLIRSLFKNVGLFYNIETGFSFLTDFILLFISILFIFIVMLFF